MKLQNSEWFFFFWSVLGEAAVARATQNYKAIKICFVWSNYIQLIISRHKNTFWSLRRSINLGLLKLFS